MIATSVAIGAGFKLD